MRLPRFIPTIRRNSPPAIVFAEIEAEQSTMQLEFASAFQKLVAKFEKHGLEKGRIRQVVAEAGKALPKFVPPGPIGSE